MKMIYVTFMKTLLASVLMGVSIYWLGQCLNIFAVVLIAMLVYFACLLVLGGVKKEDVFSVMKSFKK
jgi:hypothetical protein